MILDSAGWQPDLALLPLVLAANDQNRIVLPYLHGFTALRASEMILVNSFSRSSRATGPNMRYLLDCVISQNDHRVVIESDVGTIPTTVWFGDTYNYRMHHFMVLTVPSAVPA